MLRETKESFLLVGAVYRGRNALEGVVSGVFPRNGLELEVARVIKGSKHWGQVRVLLIDEQGLPSFFSPQALYDELGAPVIFLRYKEVYDRLFMTRWNGRVVEPIGLTESTTIRVLDECAVNGYPEALRKARMILDGIG